MERYLYPDALVSINHMAIHLNGNIYISDNTAKSILFMESSVATYSKNVTFYNNRCIQLIYIRPLYPYIKITEHSSITFNLNRCSKQLITIEPQESTPYSYCVFQYIKTDIKPITAHHLLQYQYSVQFFNNTQDDILGRSNSTINYYTFHCQWLDTAVFHDCTPSIINKNVIHIHNPTKQGLMLYRHTNLCYCHKNGTYNCTTDILGCVYPGQTLQADLCAPFTEETKVSHFYAETHNILIEGLTCQIAHQAELRGDVDKQHKKLNFTIVSNATECCLLFLTAQPDLYKYYDVFLVQLLPCPIGFTLLNGICDCDPYLVNSDLQINTCYINEVAIERLDNSWLVYQNQSDKIKYLISSHCPIDYCSPSTTKLNLEHPDSQCQFHRTSLLCSQCQNELSMIFGLSRCMRCTHVYLLLSIVVLIAGVVLVVLLYCLNLTVTKGTINGIIFYANIISINGSVFLVNDNVYKPLKAFISFTNLDLGIETCFYNGMDSYAKMWLQLFFPFYLIMMATLLIITSRYSIRIQRLTFTRSLPVLATLFLLSYTGILRNVSTSVVLLFHYN